MKKRLVILFSVLVLPVLANPVLVNASVDGLGNFRGIIAGVGGFWVSFITFLSCVM